MTTTLQRTPLYTQHQNLKARLVPFSGWEMPVQYSGILQEHAAVRAAAGLFDVSHMGEFLVSGDGACTFLNRMLTNDISKILPGGCQYNLMCYENGTVVDDLIVSCVTKDRYFLVVNAGNIAKDFEWLLQHKPQNVELQDLSGDYALLALQGPKSQSILDRVFESSFSDLKYYSFQTLDASLAFSSDRLKSTRLVSRTGYTGEDGFEILIPNAEAESLWKKLLQIGSDFGLVPVGLGARDTLRLEAAYSLYGHEINSTITALEAKLGWVVKFDKGDFIGKTALLNEKQAGSKRKICGFVLSESGIAREGCRILNLSGEDIGIVTSGTHSPTLGKAIGLALVRAEYTEIGAELLVDIRGKSKKISIVKTPFYKRAST